MQYFLFYLHQEVLGISLENLFVQSGQTTLHLKYSLVTDMLLTQLEPNKAAACERTFLAKNVSLATGFSGVTSP